MSWKARLPGLSRGYPLRALRLGPLNKEQEHATAAEGAAV